MESRRVSRCHLVATTAAVAAEGTRPLPAQAASPLLSRWDWQRDASGRRGARTRPAARPIWVGSRPRRHLRLAVRRKKTFTFCSTDARCDSCDLLFVTVCRWLSAPRKRKSRECGCALSEALLLLLPLRRLSLSCYSLLFPTGSSFVVARSQSEFSSLPA